LKKLIVFLLLLIGLLQYRLWFGDGNVLELHRLGERIEELRREGTRRQERNAALEAEVMDLKQGTDAIEERARQDLGMIKEGEFFVQVIEHQPPPSPAPASKETPKGTSGPHRRRARKPPADPVEEFDRQAQPSAAPAPARAD